MENIKHFLDVQFLIHTFGYSGLFAIIFAETGLMLGFFLPGDSLLLTAGIFASRGILNIFVLIPLLFVAATTGNIVGYIFGQKVGKRLFTKEDSILFHKSHVTKAQRFYNKYGGKAIIIARFMPIIRTFAPIVAGITDMHFPTFLLYNVIGSLLWAVGVTLAGFYLGKYVPDKYFELIIFAVIFISVAPALFEILRSKNNRDRIFIGVRNLLTKRS